MAWRALSTAVVQGRVMTGLSTDAGALVRTGVVGLLATRFGGTAAPAAAVFSPAYRYVTTKAPGSDAKPNDSPAAGTRSVNSGSVGMGAVPESAQDETVRPHDPNAFVMPHPSSTHVPAGSSVKENEGDSYMLFHPVYSAEYVTSAAVMPTHKEPVKLYEKIGYGAVLAARSSFDFFTNYGKNMTESKWLTRMLFLETVAGVPGMVSAMLRHLRSLRSMQRDHGWIHTLLEEAENERMHLLTFMQLRKTGVAFRAMVLLGQGVFFNLYMLAYMISPKTCHSFVGYLEEEAVKTYTKCLHDIDTDKNGMGMWTTKPAPEIAISYWKLAEDASMRDVILAVRADEASHKHVNHTFSEMEPTDSNPFAAGAGHCP